MLVSIPPKYSVSQFMGYLKGKSSLMIFDRHTNLKYKNGNRQFWCKGYYVDTVGRNKKVIAEYIRNQLAEDKISDQISIKEYFDPYKALIGLTQATGLAGGFDLGSSYFAALAALIASISMGVTLNRSPQMP